VSKGEGTKVTLSGGLPKADVLAGTRTTGGEKPWFPGKPGTAPETKQSTANGKDREDPQRSSGHRELTGRRELAE